MNRLLLPAAWLYRGIIRVRNRRYDRGVGVARVPRPVISVGNISVGGVGKSPTVARLAELLSAAGHRPAIAMRGYGAARGEPNDESREYGERLPGVPVLCDADRERSVTRHLARSPETDVILLDDAFQHRRIHRDLDLVLVDETQDPFVDAMLPAGRLREPVASLARADALVLTRASGTSGALVEQLTAVHGRPPIACTNHVWDSLRVFDASGERDAPVSWLEGRRVVSMLGVGHPQAIRRQIEGAGARIVRDVPVRDHARYNAEGVRRVITTLEGADGDALLVTAKDWVKLRGLLDFSHGWHLVVPSLRIEFLAGEEALRELVLRTVDDFRCPNSSTS